MDYVRKQKLDIFDFKSLAYLILENKSAEIITQSKGNLHFIINLFIDSFEIRNAYLRESADNFIFTFWDEDFNTFEESDDKFKFLLLQKLGYSFENIESLKNFLITTGKKLVVISSIQNINAQRMLQSYIDYFGGFLMIYQYNQLSLGFYSNKINFELNNNLLEYYIDQAKVLFYEIILSEINIADIKTIEEIQDKVLSYIKSNERSEKLDFIDKNKDLVFNIETENKPQENNSNKIDENLLKLNLTAREERIYDQLSKNKRLSREELAEIVWGDEGKNAKDDAIDQVISRLRSKFVKAGFDKEYIQSKKGFGIILNK
jgi:hypothetical protein